MTAQILFSDLSAARADVLIALATDLGRRSGAAAREQRSAKVALRSLAAFARLQFEFLRRGLDPGGPFVRDDRYPLEFLLEATVRQVSFDIDVLLRAMAHRNPASSAPVMRTTLGTADRLAVDALMPAVRHGLIERTVVLTYFQKTPTIRLIPYVPLAVIGCDFSAAGEPSRLLGIAHETGHHVYRQLTVNYRENLDEQIESVVTTAAAAAPSPWPRWLLAWQEEIFADVYSALTGGPAAALALQQLILTGTRRRLTVDDGDHPLDALRPEILHTALRAVAARRQGDDRACLEMTVSALEAEWQAYLADRAVPGEFLPAGEEEAVALADARSLLRRFVQELLAGALAPLVADTESGKWSQGLRDAAPATLPKLFDQFAGYCATVEKVGLPSLALADRGRRVAIEAYPMEGPGGERKVGEIGDPYLDELRATGLQGAALQPDAWKAVFLAGDWVTEEGGSGINPVTRQPYPQGGGWLLPAQPPYRLAPSSR